MFIKKNDKSPGSDITILSVQYSNFINKYFVTDSILLHNIYIQNMTPRFSLTHRKELALYTGVSGFSHSETIRALMIFHKESSDSQTGFYRQPDRQTADKWKQDWEEIQMGVPYMYINTELIKLNDLHVCIFLSLNLKTQKEENLTFPCLSSEHK